MKFILYFFLAFSVIVAACNKDKFQTKPTIRIKSMNTKVIPQNGTWIVTLECTDKEGDVQDSVIIIKKRINRRIVPTLRDTIRYKFPNFPQNIKIDIIATLGYQTILSAINPPNIPGSNPPQKEPDTLIVKFAVRDNGGHTSDTISTQQIIVIRQ